MISLGLSMWLQMALFHSFLLAKIVVCVCVYAHTHTHTYIYIYTHIYIHTHIYTYIASSFFIRSSVDGRAGFFHVLAIVNNAAMNVRVHATF